MSSETSVRRANPIKKILSSPRDWTEWYGMTKTHAIQMRIWQYLDPEMEDSEIEVLVEPIRPEIPAANSSPELISQFSYRLKFYEMDYNKWRTADTNLRTFHTDLIESVEYAKVKNLAIDYAEPRDILKKLKQRLCPTESDRRSELRHRYGNLSRVPKAQDREQWIDEWRDVVRDLVKANELDAKNAKEDFYLINREIDSTVSEIIWDRDQEMDESFDEFTERFIRKYREHALQARKGRSAFATTEPTLHGEPSSPNLAAANQSSNKPEGNNKERECLCGGKHALGQCFYINESKRPAGWKPNDEIAKKVEEKIKNGTQGLKIRINAIRKKAKEVISKRSSQATTTPLSQSTQESTEDTVYHSATTILPATMSNQMSDSHLRDSVIIDPASHIHIGNDKDRFESIEPCHQELLTGDHQTIIQGYGKMHVHLNKGDENGKPEVLRAYAAYVPGFHTNLISAKLLKEKLDVCFDQRSEELQIGSGRKLFAKLQYKLGMYCIEYNPIHTLVVGISLFPRGISDCGSRLEIISKVLRLRRFELPHCS
jgi:hypothetical protein